MFELLVDKLGDQAALAFGGALIGLFFGMFAQQSKFCLRSATLEVAHGQPAHRLAIWLFVFGSALVATQSLIVLNLFETGTVRQLNSQGSISGALVGGLLFGCGMTLTRACGSRMLVLSATGNLRALLSGLVFAVIAQMSTTGLLAPLRSIISNWWIIESTQRDLLVSLNLTHQFAIVFGLCWIALAAYLTRRHLIKPLHWLTACGVGLMVAAAWFFNYQMSLTAFEMTPVHALSFASPSAEFLMFALDPHDKALSFDLGLIPGVFAGSFIAALWSKELKLEGFQNAAAMRRYIAGGTLMGFGAILAGGCAVGAGVSGASVFTLTAWLVLWSMWLGAVITDRVIDRDTSL
jgi:uncharacterized protein